MIDFLDNKIKMLIESSNIKLIILDSITAIFRGEFDNSLIDMKNRTELLIYISLALNKINYTYKIPIIIINQVYKLYIDC